MRFSKFEFTNFKGIRKATLHLMPQSSDGGVVTLIGLNESGKTTILEGMDRFYAGGESEEIKPSALLDLEKADPYELIPIMKRVNFNDDIELRATIRLDDDDVVALKQGMRRRTGFVATAIPPEIDVVNRYKFADSTLQSSGTFWPSVLGEGRTKQGKVVHKITAKARADDWNAIIAELRERIPMVWYFPNFLFDFPDVVTLTKRDDETDSNRLFRLLFEDILQSIDPKMTVERHIVARALSSENSERQSLNQLKLAIGAEVTSTVVSQWNLLFDRDTMQGKRIFLEIETVGSEATESVQARFLLEDGSELFSIRERSLGFRWFFVYLLLTTYRVRRSGSRNILFLLDEPASNLHSSAQALLLGSLNRLTEGAQVVYTTHSHHLVNPDWLESTFVVTNDGADPEEITTEITSRKTDISVTRYPQFAYENPGKQHYFQPVLDVLAYRPAHLELVPEVIMTEGRSDYYLLKYYVDSMRGEVSPSVNLLPGRGSGTLDVVIQLYLGWGRQFVVLLDNDRGGKDGRKHYSKLFGAAVDSRIVDLSAAAGDSKLTTIESLLEEEDRLAFQRLVDPGASTWNKRAWSQGVEHAVATRAAVDISAESRARLDTVVGFLTDELVRLRSRVGSGPT